MLTHHVDYLPSFVSFILAFDMVTELPQSILFCCDHNAVRSPMAEGIMKKFYGLGTYVQSVGVYNDLEIDGFAISAVSYTHLRAHETS